MFKIPSKSISLIHTKQVNSEYIDPVRGYCDLRESVVQKMAVKEKSESEDMEWSTEEEVQLLYALDGLKPVGINKHLYMARICERLSKALKREVAPDTVWAHLRTLYNLDVLDQMERLPFAEEQVEFSLPDSEFSALISKKLAETEEKKMPDFKAEALIKSEFYQCFCCCCCWLCFCVL